MVAALVPRDVEAVVFEDGSELAVDGFFVALGSAGGADFAKKLNEDGATIIMITHEQEIAEHANKIYYIRDGELREDK